MVVTSEDVQTLQDAVLLAHDLDELVLKDKLTALWERAQEAQR